MLRVPILFLLLASTAAYGDPLWQFSTDGMISGNPVVHQDSVYVTGGTRLPGGKMAGWLGWEGFNLDPVIYNGVVYVGSRGTHVYAIDAKTGVEKWSWKHPTSWVGSPAIVSDEVIYFGMPDGNSLIGLETRMGNQSLLFRDGFYNFARPQANDREVFLALDGKTLYAGSANGNLYAISHP